MERCVDDSVMWADNIKDSFTKFCKYFDLCARNGIVLNPKKFQFCRETVDFAGLQVIELCNIIIVSELLKVNNYYALYYGAVGFLNQAFLD